MAVRPIRLLGDPMLRSRAEEVVDFDRRLAGLVEDLTDTMLAAPGAGLAAPQIGVGLRVFTFHVGGELGHLVNPRIEVIAEQAQDGHEGCLSVPGLCYGCRRARQVVARGLDKHGEPLELPANDFLARAFQHETDHLDGVLFVDRLEIEVRRDALRRIRQAQWGGVGLSRAPRPWHPVFGVVR